MKKKGLCQVLLLLLGFTVHRVAGSFGGHDLFTSLAQLKMLWINDQAVVQDMKQLLTKLELVQAAVKSYISSHEKLKLDQEPNFDFLGHPVNAYHLVKHVAIGWQDVRQLITGKAELNITEASNFTATTDSTTQPLLQDLIKLKQREVEKLPDFMDVEGAAYGFVRLHSLYQLNLTSLERHGIIEADVNHQHVISRPSVLPIDSFDYRMFAEQAGLNGLYDCTSVFYELSYRQRIREIKSNVTLHPAMNFSLSDIKINLRKSKEFHDQILLKRGMRSGSHRTNQYPFDEKLRKKKKFSKPFSLPTVLDRMSWSNLEGAASVDMKHKDRHSLQQELQTERLCRGEEIRSPEETAHLRCLYVHHGSPWLRLGPAKMQINSYDPYHVVFKDMLYPHECDKITEFLAPQLDFPPGRMNLKSKKNDWTMKNCWPNEDQNVYLDKLNRRIEHMTGLWAATNKNYSEPFMCGNYGIGGFYWVHPDYHIPKDMDFEPGSTGNRVATILTILEAPEAGGATAWPYAGLSVFPEKGSAVFWHNLFSSSIPDTFTRHSACPVLLGQKWIGNKWVGYNAQWNKRKCQLHPYSMWRPITE